MRICYLNHDTRTNTGAGRFFNDFSRAVERVIPGVEFDILTSENLIFPNKLKLLLALPAIRRIMKQCDVIHALDGWPYGVVAALASIGLKKKLIITAIGTGAVQPLHRPFQKMLMAWAYRRADRVVAVSNNTKREILAVIPGLPIEVIHHGVDVSRFRNIVSGYEKELDPLKPFVLSVGSLKKRKGFDYSIEAFAAIAGEFPDLKYVIVGGGPEHQNLKIKISNLKLENRIIFLEHIPQDFLAALYQHAELFMLLSQDIGKDLEGFGLVFLEAAANGLPVIGTRDTGAEDAINDGKNGFLVPARDANAAAEMMRILLRDQKIKASFAKESVVFAHGMSWEKAARSYKKIYDVRD